jgi:hypothetical protein
MLKFTFPKSPDHEVSVLDTIMVDDPFGYGLRFEILRADHEDCKRYDEAYPESGFSSLHTRGALAQMVGAGANQGQLLDDLASRLEQRGVNMLQGDLERGKRKLALAVIKSWSGIASEGVELPFSPIVALEFLGFRGYGWRLKDDPNWVVKTAAEFERVKDTMIGKAVLQVIAGKPSKLLAAAQEFTGEHRDEKGAVRVIPRTRKGEDGKIENIPYGGNPFGLAFNLMLHEASMKASAAFAKAEEADAEAFPPSPDTARESGGESGSSASVSSSDTSEASTAATAPAAQ